MKQLTKTEFLELISDNDWSRESHYEAVNSETETSYSYNGDGEETQQQLVVVTGYGFCESTFGELKITFNEDFTYTEEDEDSFTTFNPEQDKWVFEGFEVVDDDGEAYNADDFWEELEDHGFNTVDYSSLEIKTVLDVDVDDSIDDEAHTVHRDYQSDIRFTGEVIASVSSSANNSSPSYSGSTGRWTKLVLYKTQGGKFVCEQIDFTQWVGESDSLNGKACETTDEVIEFFGHRWLAKELYEEAEIEAAIDIDLDKDSDMQTYTVTRDNLPSLRFTGEVIASVSSSANNSSPSYSGSTGRWTKLVLYKTQGGKFICEQIGFSNWQGERDFYSGKACETTDEVIEFFGHRWLAKELYEEAQIEDVLDID